MIANRMTTTATSTQIMGHSPFGPLPDRRSRRSPLLGTTPVYPAASDPVSPAATSAYGRPAEESPWTRWTTCRTPTTTTTRGNLPTSEVDPLPHPKHRDLARQLVPRPPMSRRRRLTPDEIHIVSRDEVGHSAGDRGERERRATTNGPDVGVRRRDAGRVEARDWNPDRQPRSRLCRHRVKRRRCGCGADARRDPPRGPSGGQQPSRTATGAQRTSGRWARRRSSPAAGSSWSSRPSGA